jgi:hypothetical protein
MVWVSMKGELGADFSWGGLRELLLGIKKGAVSTLPQQYEVTSYWTDRRLLPRTSLTCPRSAEAPGKGLNGPRTG